jgi:hypothetical protein
MIVKVQAIVDLPLGSFRSVVWRWPVGEELVMMRYHTVNRLDRQIKCLRNMNGMPGNIVKTGVVRIWCRGRRALNLGCPNEIADAPNGFILQAQDLFGKNSVDPVRVIDIT